jgi:hypothetical protein
MRGLYNAMHSIASKASEGLDSLANNGTVADAAALGRNATQQATKFVKVVVIKPTAFVVGAVTGLQGSVSETARQIAGISNGRISGAAVAAGAAGAAVAAGAASAPDTASAGDVSDDDSSWSD